jgi:hypothetical protein
MQKNHSAGVVEGAVDLQGAIELLPGEPFEQFFTPVQVEACEKNDHKLGIIYFIHECKIKYAGLIVIEEISL